MTSSMNYLSLCTTPGMTATVFDPIRPQYYLKDAAPVAPPPAPAQTPAVTVTLSNEAQAAMKSGS